MADCNESSSRVTGFFVLSVDVDEPVGSGLEFDRRNDRERRSDATGEAMHRLVRLLEGHALSATWVVGETALLEGSVGRRSDRRSERLLGAIAGMTMPQEIALSPSVDDGLDVLRSAGLGRRNGMPVRTLALSVDVAVDLNQYAAFGFTACRQAPPSARQSELIDDLFQRPIPMWRPTDLECAGPILNVPVSMMLADIDGQRRLVPEAARIRRIRNSLERAIIDGAFLHLAFRLADLEFSMPLFRTIEDVLFHVCEVRAGGDLEVATIDGLRRAYDALSDTVAPDRAA